MTTYQAPLAGPAFNTAALDILGDEWHYYANARLACLLKVQGNLGEGETLGVLEVWITETFRVTIDIYRANSTL